MPGALAAVYVGVFDMENSRALSELACAVESALKSASVRVAGRCVGPDNTKYDGAAPQPRARGLAVHLASGEARPASLSHSLADVPHGTMRAALGWYRPAPGTAPEQDSLSWVCATPQGPRFPATVLECALERRVGEALLHLPDSELLGSCSTSPAAEDAGFCDRLRASITFALQHPRLQLPPPGPVP